MNRWSYHVPILAYHKVGLFKGDHVPTVSAEAFERQLAFLVRHRFRVMGLDALNDHLQRNLPMPQRTVVITFDDGYEETYSVAWPLLKKYGCCAIVFVTVIPTVIVLPTLTLVGLAESDAVSDTCVKVAVQVLSASIVSAPSAQSAFPLQLAKRQPLAALVVRPTEVLLR